HPWRIFDPGPLVEGLGLARPRAWPNPSYWPGWMGHDGALFAARIVVAALVVVPACAMLVSLARQRKKIPRSALGTCALAIAIVVTIAGFGHARVRASFDPVLCVLAAEAAVIAWHRLPKSGYVRRGMPGARQKTRAFSLVELMNFLALA